MGEKVVVAGADLADRQLYRHKLRQCVDALERLLAEERFDRPRAMMGLEIEINLADEAGQPAMRNEAVLEEIASGDFQTELGQFNIEVRSSRSASPTRTVALSAPARGSSRSAYCRR
jgi:hypothetical protein